MKTILEYVWIFDNNSTNFYTKTKVVDSTHTPPPVDSIPHIHCTKKITKATQDKQLYELVPAFVCCNPFSDRDNSFIVYCDAVVVNLTENASNVSSQPNLMFSKNEWEGAGLPISKSLRNFTLENSSALADLSMQISFKQEYYLLIRDKLKYPSKYNPTGQYGNDISARHFEFCLDAGIDIVGFTSKDGPGQWSFEIGKSTDTADFVGVCDQLMASRYILHKICALAGVKLSFDVKPYGDLPSSACSMGISVHGMRVNDTNRSFSDINGLLQLLGSSHHEFVKKCGYDAHKHMVGNYKEFKYGTSVNAEDGCVKIPYLTSKYKQGKIVDKRLCSDINPYEICKFYVDKITGCH